MITVAECLAAGMPLSAVVGKAEIMDSVYPGGLGGTYGANPVAHAGIDIFEEEVLLNTSEKPGARLAERFVQWQEKMDIVNEVRGKGAMVGLTLVKKDGRPAAE